MSSSDLLESSELGPPEADGFSEVTVRRIRAAVEAFEAELRGGLRPKLERFVAGPSRAERRERLRRLLIAEVRHLRGQGVTPSAAEYLGRFPDDAELIAQVFDATEADPVVPPVFVVWSTERPVGEGPTADAGLDGSTVADEPGGGSRDSEASTSEGTVRPDEGPTVSIPQAEPKVVPVPDRVGDFEIIKELGAGSYGVVYQALDVSKEHYVSIKVPRPGLLDDPARAEQFRDEALKAARLNHPAVVRVIDLLREENGRWFIVMEYIDGQPLSTHLRAHPVDYRKLAGLLAEIADGIDAAHRAGLVHRDLKPSNILIDREGRPRIVDFGLALHEDAMHEHAGEVAGTVRYMAPEQVRGESHRLDGRADIWALGVVLYQMLASRHPFRGSTRQQVFEEILRKAPKPPRQIDGSVPRDLERICLKCLSRRLTDRYLTASDLASDLRYWLADEEARDNRGSVPPSDPAAVPVPPGGLKPFNSSDHAAYLSLVPGPFERDGFPTSLSFWKTRIESTDPALAFAVGLLYGPSGSGKSSMIRAGLLPRLGDRVHAVVVEAAPFETDLRLSRALRREFPDLPDALTPASALQALRLAPALRRGKKVLIVIDQFEQWLQTHRADPQIGLTQALRQCDGLTVQTLLLVRDDFGMAAMRFMEAVEEPVVQGRNYAVVDRFDLAHASEVLERFGRSLRRLPAEGELTPEQRRFLLLAVDGMAEAGKVSAARLSLFAEMFRGKEWTPASLKSVEGTEGVGVPFLEESLGERVTDPRRRAHREAAVEVLKALLPPAGSNIRGHMKSEQELIKAAGYVGRPRAFAELMGVLDGDLRLVSPCEPDRETAAGGDAPRYFQLTHDYLIPALRRWLTRTQSATLRGRAEMLLEARAVVWSAAPERRFLPSVTEWLKIVLLTRRSSRTGAHRRMVRVATRFHLSRIAALMIVLAGLMGMGWSYYRNLERTRRETAALQQVTGLFHARPEEVPRHLNEMAASRRYWHEEMHRVIDDPKRSQLEHTRAYLALAREEPVGVGFLAESLVGAEDLREHQAVAGELARWSDQVAPILAREFETPDPDGGRHLRAAVGLAALSPGSVGPQDPDGVVRGLLAEGLDRGTAWGAALVPLRDWIAPSLRKIFEDPRRPGPERTLAAEVLAGLAEKGDPSRLAELLLVADPERLALILNRARAYPDAVVPALEAALDRGPVGTRDGAELAARRANAVVSLIRLDRPARAWRWFRVSVDPDVRDLLIHRLVPLGVRPEVLLDRFEREEDPSARQSLLLALGQSVGGEDSAPLEPAVDPALLRRIEKVFREHPDAAVHAAAEWLLRRWSAPERLAGLIDGERGTDHVGWSVNGVGMTMVKLPPARDFPLRDLNSPDPERPDGPMRTGALDYGLAVSAHEITVALFLRYSPEYVFDREVCPDPNGPMSKVTWYEGVKFCRWLSEQEGVPEDQMCYPPIDEIVPGRPLKLPDDFMRRTGYRLPTEAEWEMFARGGTRTPWYFGNTPRSMGDYAWFLNNAENRVWPVGSKMPNPFGLFDVYGNVIELCGNYFEPGGGEKEGRAMRGGGYITVSWASRSGSRFEITPERRLSYIGLRVVRTLGPAGAP